MITCTAVEGIGEVLAGDDLARLVTSRVTLRDGDVLVVTSKVVSKAEGRVVAASKEQALAEETDRVVARRGATAIVRTRHGLVMAAAGIDASNTPSGTLVLLPRDPDGSARALREGVEKETGANVAVLLSDTFGRAWRTGQTDVAVGAAGLHVTEDHAGREDGYGNVLAVTAPATADEITGAADLVTGKLGRAPAAVVRGLERLVLPAGEHGPGAAALVRPEEQDMFGLGSREAVMTALARGDRRGFGSPASPGELVSALCELVPDAAVTTSGPDRVEVRLPGPDRAGDRLVGALTERAEAAAFALGWSPASPDAATPAPDRCVRLVRGTP